MNWRSPICNYYGQFELTCTANVCSNFYFFIPFFRQNEALFRSSNEVLEEVHGRTSDGKTHGKSTFSEVVQNANAEIKLLDSCA